MLRRPLRRWLGPLLGPLARKTSLLVDASFLAYDDRSPFFIAPGADRTAVKRTISTFLKSQRKVDSVWIAEPPDEAAWAAGEGYAQFHTLPMVHVDVAGCASLEAYAAQLDKKRRRNFRHERAAFAAAGATIETHAGPLAANRALLEQLLACLAASADHSQFTVPYNDVLTDPAAFAEQPQTALVARVDGRAVGFMSFLQDGDRLLQCHGGLDYARSHEVLAYHNLIYAAIDEAIRRGCRLLSMGPLNNETKRRAGSALKPIVASLWIRNPVDRLLAKKFFIKNFEVYQGPAGSPSPQPDRSAAPPG
jgi:predicted N-acyltransferase